MELFEEESSNDQDGTNADGTSGAA
jgi:hypothetical protein